MTQHDLGEGSAEYEIWHQGHVLDCDKNNDWSSPGMEVDAAETL